MTTMTTKTITIYRDTQDPTVPGWAWRTEHDSGSIDHDLAVECLDDLVAGAQPIPGALEALARELSSVAYPRGGSLFDVELELDGVSIGSPWMSWSHDAGRRPTSKRPQIQAGREAVAKVLASVGYWHDPEDYYRSDDHAYVLPVVTEYDADGYYTNLIDVDDLDAELRPLGWQARWTGDGNRDEEDLCVSPIIGGGR